MKIKTQVSVSLIIFVILAVLIIFSVYSSNNQFEEMNKKEQVINEIEKDSFELYFLENEYLLHTGTRPVEQWNSKYDELSGHLKELTVTDPDQQIVLSSLLESHAELHTTFSNLVALTVSAQGKEPVSASQRVREFAASTLTGQTQRMMSKSSELSQMIKAENLRIHETTTLIFSSSIAALMIFVFLNYFLINRSVLRSVSTLQKGARQIGTGDLDTKIETGTSDELGDLSFTITAMASNLKTVLTSKSELEKEIAERKLAEEALRESELRFGELFENMSSGVAIYQVVDGGNDFIFKDFNKAGERIEGVSRKDIIGKRVSEAFPSVREYGLFEIFQRVWRTGNPEFHPVSLYRDNRISGWRENYILKLLSGEIVAIYDDVTEHKLAEEALRESEERFRGITERISDLIIIVDSEGYMTFVSPSVTSILGFPPEAYIGKRAGPDIIHPEDVVKIGQVMERLKNGSPGEQVEVRMPKSDGSYAVFEGTGIPVFNQGIFAGVQVVARDITDRKRAELELVSAQESLKEAHRLAHIGIWDWVMENDTVTWSEELFNIAGRDPSLQAPTYAEHPRVYTPASWDRLSGAVTRALTTGEPYNLELEIVRPDGSIRWVNAFGGVKRDGKGKVIGLQGTVQDINERKRAEEERERIRSWRAGVNRILESVLAPAPLDQKLNIITDGVVETFGADFCRIWLIDKGDLCSSGCMHAEAGEGPHACRYREKCLHLKASSGRYTHIDGKAHRRVPFGVYKIGRIASGEETKFLTNDVEHDPRVHDHEWARSLGLVAFSGYRLKTPDSDVLGVFALFARFPISPDMDAILDGLSRAISLAIQKDIADKALQESERKFHTMADFTVDWEYWLAPDSRFVYISPSCEGITGYSAKEFIADPALITRIVHPDDAPLVSDHFSRIHKSPEPGILDFRIVGRGGETRWLAHTCLPVYDRSGTYLGRRASNRDITDRKRAEEEILLLNATLEQRVRDRTQELEQATETIRASLDEKVVLLREIHHRVKNNLQIIISLLNLQSRYIEDEKTSQAIKESQNRIRAMALVHEKLYQSTDIEKIDLDNYIRFLGNSLFQFYGMSGKGIILNTQIQDIRVDINTAIPVGLIVNELVSNSLKHAFPGGRRGEISLAIHREDHTLTILFKDNGVGIPQDLDWHNAKSLGLRLVISLVEQLQGTIELDRSAGTVFTIVVKEKE